MRQLKSFAKEKKRLTGDTLGVDGGQVGILEQGHEVGLCRLLERHDGGGLEAEVGLDARRSEWPAAECD